MKRFLSLVLCLIFLLGATGCAKEPEKIENKKPVTEEKVEEKPQEPEIVEPTSFDIKLSFVGDMLLASQLDSMAAGSFNKYAATKPPSYFLKKVKHIFEADDFTLVDIENVFTDKKLSPINKNYSPAFWFKSKTSNTEILTSSSVEGVSLANNHIGDYGATGRKDTINAIKDAGLPYGIEGTIMYLEKDGFKLAVICHGLWGEYQANTIIKEIKKAEKQSDYQIVYFHGGTEKIHKPEAWKKRALRKLVDNGADLVVGNHPHVLQPREVYKGVEIVYSMGNFCYGGHRHPENRTIIYQMNLTIDIATNTVTGSQSNIIPCYVYTGKSNNYQPCVIKDKKIKQRVLDFMEGKTNSPL